jgi:NAD(P)-dependent dehydrogenase (short-subunit alcohol dehydrogenase family)
MEGAKKVLIFGGAGRVGLGLVNALLRHNIDISVADFIDKKRLSEKISRVIVDTRLSNGDVTSQVNVYGNFDVLNKDKVTELLDKEKPDIVVNYAIPFTWDAAKQLPNYDRISRAGLGAFAAVQVLAPKIIAQALAASGIGAKYIVGNLPDITIPIIYGIKKHQQLVLPIAGAGNVGLIEAGIKHQIAMERQAKISDLRVFLVAHHVHWVAPREPGYRNDAPFLLKVMHQDNDITKELGSLRELMNRSIVSCYEAGAGFSSTTALLAAKLVLSLLDEEEKIHPLHVPAPNGLPGGYPVTVKNGTVNLDLPSEWQHSEAVDLMRQAHQRDGIDRIEDDGSIHFDPQSVAILKKEVGINLPEIVRPSEVEMVAREQIRLAKIAIKMI